MLSPLGWGLALVKCLPRNWFAYRDLELLVPVLEHLITEVQHGNVELYSQHLVYVGKTVEELGILTLEMYGHNIALRLYTLGYECLFPIDVADYALALAGTEAGREHDNVILTFKSGVYLLREIACLLACLVYGHPEFRKVRDIHEKVIDKKLYFPFIVRTKDVGQSKTILSAQRVIAHERTETVLWKILETIHLE